MQIVSEKLKGFRNIESAEFNPSPYVNVICGENGQGKTNLLESIFLLTGAKSFRHVKDKELIKKHTDEFSVIESEFISSQRHQTVRLTISEKGRMASLNKASEKKASDIAGNICCVVFSPDHMELVKGTPAQRRKFIDTALCQLSPRYYRDLKDYTRILEQRNTLLKDARNISAAFDILDVYDGGLANCAASITEARINFCGELSDIAAEVYGEISANREELGICYSAGSKKKMPDCGEYLSMFSASRQDDIRAGFTTLGPHRDDLIINLDGDNSRTFASQGQQRTAVLSMKMAEAEIFRKQLGEEPILLLDDVLSELDGMRQEYLIRKLGSSQAIITCCDPNFIEKQTDADIFKMTSGVLEKM